MDEAAKPNLIHENHTFSWTKWQKLNLIHQNLPFSWTDMPQTLARNSSGKGEEYSSEEKGM